MPADTSGSEPKRNHREYVGFSKTRLDRHLPQYYPQSVADKANQTET